MSSSRSRAPHPRNDLVKEISGRDFSEFGVDSRVYDLPVDTEEEERQDLLNWIVRQRLGAIVLAPSALNGIDEPVVLDLGYGKGAWIDDLLSENEDAVVTGIDIFLGEDQDAASNDDNDDQGIEEFIKKRWNLNVPFPQDRSESRLRPETFDLINCRFLAEGIDKNRWPTLIGELRRLLKPEGYIQMVEPYLCFQSDNGRLPETSASNAWWSWYTRYMEICNRDARVGRRLEQLCREQGFEQVTSTQYRLPIGAWEPGRAALGREVRRAVLQLFKAMAVPFVQRAEMPPEVCRAVAARAGAELSLDEVKAYFVLYVVTARRPRPRR